MLLYKSNLTSIKPSEYFFKCFKFLFDLRIRHGIKGNDSKAKTWIWLKEESSRTQNIE